MTAGLGIGVLSFAHGHISTYCRRYVQDEDVELVSAWDDNVERGQAAAESFGMRYSPHVEDVLQNPQVEAVLIGSETNRHAELVQAAAAAGKHILLQKPMALTLSDCDQIIDAVDRAGVQFMLAYQMRHDPANQRMKQLLDEGALGQVNLLRRRHAINVLFNRNFITGPSRWHLDPEKNMGMFMDDASHAADFIYWFMGRPSSVMAEIDNTLTDVAPDDTGVAIYRFPNRAMAILVNSSVTLAGENTTEIYGDQGVLIQNHGDVPSTNHKLLPGATALKYFGRDQAAWQDLSTPIPAQHGERIAGVARPFIDCVRHGYQPPVNARDGRVSVEMILAAYRSARTGQRVSWPLEP